MDEIRQAKDAMRVKKREIRNAHANGASALTLSRLYGQLAVLEDRLSDLSTGRVVFYPARVSA